MRRLSVLLAFALLPALAWANPPAIGADQLTHLDEAVQQRIQEEADALAAIEAELVAARSDLALIEAVRSGACSELSDARGELAVTKEEAAAAKDLAKAGVDSAKAGVEAEPAARASAEVALDQARDDHDTAKARVDQAKAAVKKATADKKVA